jgi:hypothetical protein
LIHRKQPVETGWIRDGESAPRVDAGSFGHFELDASSRLTRPVARRMPAEMLS